MKRVAFIVAVMAIIGMSVKGQNVSPFHTIGYDYQRTKVPVVVEEPDTLDVDDYVDEGNVCEPPSDSIRVYLPMVSLPLKDIKETSPFGMRRDPMNRAKYRYHSGVDLSARYENVYSMLPVTVSEAGFSKTGGNYVTVNHGVCSYSYLHLSKIRVKVGEHVSAGQNIAVSGNTGSRTTSPHLHLPVRLNTPERKYFNPMLILGFVSEQLLKYEHLKSHDYGTNNHSPRHHLSLLS